MTPSVSELRGQLARMLESPLFASRPRSAELLTYFVEHSIRNGFAPINQQEIAIHGLGFGQDFSPARSAEVRVKVARLRKALDNYFRGPGRGDELVLGISQGPYRLLATRNGAVAERQAGSQARHSRHRSPTLLVVESQVSGGPGHDGLGLDASARICSLLVENVLVTVSGPLRRASIDANGADTAVSLAEKLGYDFVLDSEIDIQESRWRARATITDTRNSELVADVRHAFDPQATAVPVEEFATWVYHRTTATFTARR